MKKIFGMLIALTFLLTSCNSSNVIKRINFAETGDEKVDLSESSIINNVKNYDNVNNELKIYKVNRQKLTKNDIDIKKKKFGLDNNESKSLTNELYTTYSNGNKQLKLYSNGSLQYLNYQEGYEYRDITCTDEQAYQKADQFLKENDLLPDDFTFYNVSNNDTEISTPDNKVNKITCSKTVMYKRNINGIPVVGNSHIYVIITQDGISEVSIAYSKYLNDRNVHLVSPDSAIDKIKSSDTSFKLNSNKNSGKIKQIEIQNIELVYVNHCYDQKETHIQPCYRFTGNVSDNSQDKTEFSAIVRAIPDEITIK